MLKLKRSYDSFSDSNSTPTPLTHHSNNIQQCPTIKLVSENQKRHKYQQQAQNNSITSTHQQYSQFFNNVNSPIDDILDKIKNTESIKKPTNTPTKQQQAALEQQQKQIEQEKKEIEEQKQKQFEEQKQLELKQQQLLQIQQQIQQQQLFTLEQVQEIVKKALKENEEKLRVEYEQIVKDKLIEQYQCFSRYNDDYISKQMKESEYSYWS